MVCFLWNQSSPRKIAEPVRFDYDFVGANWKGEPAVNIVRRSSAPNYTHSANSGNGCLGGFWFCTSLTWCGVLGARKKRLNTGKPVLDVQLVLLHQQREMQLLRAQVENVTGLLLHQTELIKRQAVPVSAKVPLQSDVWQSGNRTFGSSTRIIDCNGGS